MAAKVFNNNVTRWQTYTPIFTNMGTVTGMIYSWRRNGDNLEVIGHHTNGTVAAGTATISIPVGLTINTTIMSAGASFVVGDYGNSQNNNNAAGLMLAQPGSSNNTVGFGGRFQDVNQNCVNRQNGNAVLLTGQDTKVKFEVPITEWA